jgi:hypothetical protein
VLSLFGPLLRSFRPALRIRVRQQQNRRGSQRQNRRSCGRLRLALTLQGVHRPTDGLAEFTIVDRVDSGLSLPPHHFRDRLAKVLFVSGFIDGYAPLSRAHKFQ